MTRKKKEIPIGRNPIQPNKKKQHKLQNIPLGILVFILVWIFCGGIYGDVFYITEQFSFFAFDSVLMKEVTDIWYAPIMIIGRLFLLLFKYPLLGGLMYALVLTCSAWLISYIFNLKGYFRLISAFVPFAWLFVLEYLGLNIFYQYEPSFVCSYPLLFLFVLILIAASVRLVTKRKFKESWLYYKKEKTIENYSAVVFCLLLFTAMTAFAQTKGQNTVYTAKMQRMLQKQDWDGIVSLGSKAKQPSRPVACYYAIALEMTDQLNEKLFDMFYQYPDIKLVNRTGGADVGTFMYEPDADFYSGLVLPSYHNNMEHVVASGLTIYRLKQLYLCALANKETSLAEKYMTILEKVPFEGNFVNRYKPMMYDRNLVMADPVLSKVIDMMPTKDVLEEQFINPLFLAYYKSVASGRSLYVYKNSLAASLYTKDINDFLNLMTVYNLNGAVPEAFYDVFVIYAIKSKNKEFLANAPVYCIRRIQQMLKEARQMGDIDKKIKAQKLREKYSGSYAYYYYYQNVPDENYNTPTESAPEGKEKKYNKVN